MMSKANFPGAEERAARDDRCAPMGFMMSVGVLWAVLKAKIGQEHEHTMFF